MNKDDSIEIGAGISRSDTEKYPDQIFLIDIGPGPDEGVVWCDCAAPGQYMNPDDAVRYVRADADMDLDALVSDHPAAEAELEQLRNRVGQLQDRLNGGAAPAPYDKMREAVYSVLQSHLLHHWCTESDEKLPLVDQLSVGPDISTGKEELELIAEAIADALTQQPESKTKDFPHGLNAAELQIYCAGFDKGEAYAYGRQQPESEPVGEFTAATLTPLTDKATGNFLGVLYEGAALKAGDKLYTAPQPSAQVPDNWLPTPENINALPDPVRQYIHDLVANADPAGMVRENILVRDENQMLRALVDEQQRAAQVPEGWEDVLNLLFQEMDSRFKPDGRGNAPGHGHSVPGIWDSDNGDLAGKPCAWCAIYNKAKSMLTATPSIAEKRETTGPIYTCKGKGGRYEYLGSTTGAGKSRGQSVEVYRDAGTGRLFHRDQDDFWDRMELLEPSYIAEKREEEGAKEDCDLCEGSGDDTGLGTQCPECGGTGEQRPEPPEVQS